MKLFRNLAIILVLLICGYSGFWWYQADKLQTQLSQDYGVRSDVVTKRGFPLAIELELKNPKFLLASLTGEVVCSYSIAGKLQSLQIPEKSQLQFPLVSVTVDNLFIQFARRVISADRQSIRLNTKVTGLKAEVQDNPYSKLAAQLAQKSGTNLLAFDVEFEIPSNQALEQLYQSPLLLLTHLPSISVRLNNFESADNFQDSKWKGNLMFGEDQDKNVKLLYASDMNIMYKPGLYNVLLETVDTYLKGVIPHFGDFGAIDWKNDGLIELNKTNGHWQFQLNDLGLSCDLYGADLHAKVKGNLNGVTLAEAAVDVKNIEPLVRDIVGYYNRLIAAFSQTRKPLSSQTIDKILAYLREVATEKPAEPSHMLFEMRYTEGVGSFGKLSLDDFKAKSTDLWNAILQETEPTPQPPPPVPKP